MFNFVRMSDGGIVRLKNIRSEVDIISDIASKVLTSSPIDFREFKNHQAIRKVIAKIVPGFEKMETIDQTREEFHIAGRVFHEPQFSTPNYKANFKAIPIPPLKGDIGEFCLMTIRSEGQFNSIIYDEEDIYRGQTQRDIVLMNLEDIQKKGLQPNDRVTVISKTGKLEHILLREFDIPVGNVAMYFPEANILVPAVMDGKSKTPSFKSLSVKIIAE